MNVDRSPSFFSRGRGAERKSKKKGGGCEIICTGMKSWEGVKDGVTVRSLEQMVYSGEKQKRRR